MFYRLSDAFPHQLLEHCLRQLLTIGEKAGEHAAHLRRVGGDAVIIGEDRIALADLRAAHEGFFPKLMGSELTPDV